MGRRPDTLPSARGNDVNSSPFPSRSLELPASIRAGLVIGLLYVFLVGVGLLESGIQSMGADVQTDLFDSVTNPLAGVFVGVLATVLVQSSSVTTATIVALVAGSSLSVGDAVPVIMGANMGTTVTNTLAALGHMRQGPEFKRAFAAATVHDFFNVLAVMVLLPLETQFGVLSGPAEWMSGQLVGSGGTTWKSPIKRWVKNPVGWVEDGVASLGLDGNWLGVALLLVGLTLILVGLAFITKNMRQLIADRVERSVNQVLGRGGGLVAMALGLVITLMVQSSSITTSILVPLSATGVLSLANAFPVTLGANVGTTITALLASLATDSPESLTVALSHTLFNLAGIAIFYPMKRLRQLPITLAERLSEVASDRRPLAFAYVIGAFIILPIVGIAILR
ncbi:MAG: sodium dependent phosphate transporter [Actinomycetia bacterium]|nr:sodium dependent phosphate transporter [Actinomycetes bacterium]